MDNTVTKKSNGGLIFKLSKSTSITIYIASSIFIVIGIMLILRLGNYDNLSKSVTIFIIGIGLIAFAIYSAVSTNKSKLEILNDKIVDTGIFRCKQLLLENISGFRINNTRDGKIIILEPKNSKDKSITIAINLIDRQNELLEWINNNLSNLDELEYKKEIELVLDDNTIGINKEQRELQLANAKRWAKILNFGSVILGFWTMIYPKPYELAVSIMALIPIVSFLSIKYFKGLIKFNYKDDKIYPGVDGAIFTSLIILSLRALVDWDILEWNNFWSPFLVISFFLWSFIFILIPELKSKKSNLIIVLFISLVYGYASTIILNGMLGKRSQDSYNLLILDKRTKEGENTEYYLKLEPWKKDKESDEYVVLKKVYDKYKVGDRAEFVITKGSLGIPYYKIY